MRNWAYRGSQQQRVDGVDVELPADADQETKELFLLERDLANKLQQIHGESGAQTAKRRKVDLQL